MPAMSTSTAPARSSAPSTSWFAEHPPLPGHPLQAPFALAGADAIPGGLSAAEIEQFHARGWVVRRGCIGQERIAALAEEIDGLHERMAGNPAPEGVGVSWEPFLREGRPRRIRQLIGSERAVAQVDALSRCPEILAVMHQLIGPDLYLYHSKLMMKAAHDGSFTPWHQDFQYWHSQSMLPTQVNAMLSIDASDEGNGALRMIDGSHRLGLLKPATFAVSSFNIGLPGELDSYPSTLVETAPGDVVFFGAYVIHGSGPNTSDRDRRANTFAFDRPGNRRWTHPGGDAGTVAHHRAGRRDQRHEPTQAI